jgi:hypothetical protein
MRKVRIKTPQSLRAAIEKATVYRTVGGIDRNGEEAIAKRKALADTHMSVFDKQPRVVRDILNGLPYAPDLPLAFSDGCRSQDDAEEWCRRNYGASAVERLA